MSAIRRVGILGLGKMGAPMAKHLLAAGFSVAGYDPVTTASPPGIHRMDSPHAVARASELVIIVVGFEHEVEAALFGANGIMDAARPGLIVALGSTVAPRYARSLAERLGRREVTLLDIPLARGEAAAVAGKLLIYGAGDESSFEACRPAFARSLPTSSTSAPRAPAKWRRW